MKLLDFELTTPERTAIKAKVRQVTVPTSEGEITVLPDHLPIVAPILAGEMQVVGEDGKVMLVAVSGGFVTVHPPVNPDATSGHGAGASRMEILADTAERAEELDLKAIEAAMLRAQEALKEKIDDEERQAEATAGLARELARLKVVRKHRSKQGFQHLQ